MQNASIYGSTHPGLTKGLGAFVFGHGPDPVLYNCSMQTDEQWYAQGERQPIHGVILLVASLLNELITGLALTIMYCKKLTNSSCYMIMFGLGIYEMLGIVMASLIPGIYYLLGSVYCNFPTVNYVVGCTAIGLYTGCCWCLILLALNRLACIGGFAWMSGLGILDSPKVVKKLLIVSIVPVMLAAFFSPPVFFNTRAMTYLFTPLIHADAEHYAYGSDVHSFNNLATSCIIIGSYAYMAIQATWVRLAMKAPSAKTFQRQIFIQSIVICAINAGGQVFYVLVQFPAILNTLPQWSGLLAQILWQLGNASSGVMYVTINKTIRGAIFDFFRKNGHHLSQYTNTKVQSTSVRPLTRDEPRRQTPSPRF